MAELRGGLAELFEPVARHDPVTGRVTVYVRRRHNLLRSARQEAFRACVGDLTRGRRYRGHGAAEDVREARQALAQAAHACAARLS